MTKLMPLLLTLGALALPGPASAQKPSPRLHTPRNSVLILIDHQPQMA